ncbi:hypothetical protein GN330_16680 [Nitratireductor sp. CAU 1489]|uniref:Uncharacterized protein n=1 Tax=Nitratireductor arenosus TaxID=2682096 RepID=A0A844QHW8_9HYPH|nr:hypothetical protein [Nitratireductor arenosus]MVA98885.1 hypothetical protein [Nitratireductor arenosus]
MTNEHQKQDGRTPDLVERLRTMTAMINMGEKVSMVYETELRHRAAAEIERLRAKLAEARVVIEPFARRAGKLDGHWREGDTNWSPAYGYTAITIGHLRAAAEWMGDGDGPDDMRAPLGARFSIDHDGFVGTVIGYYRRHDGKRGVVLQQDGTKVVHVYGEKWLKAERNR